MCEDEAIWRDENETRSCEKYHGTRLPNIPLLQRFVAREGMVHASCSFAWRNSGCACK